MFHKDYYRKSSVRNKNSLIVGLNGPDAKMNWLAVNRKSWGNFDFDFDLLEAVKQPKS
jgi:hypothetical protein